VPFTLLFIPLFWLLWAVVANRSAAIAPRPNPLSGLALLAVRAYARALHRLRVENIHHIPRSHSPGPLLIVANHASGADPLLIQAACPFEITWLMAADMAHPLLGTLWKHLNVILIDRRNPSGFPLRDALRALREGRVLAIFPEGRIERPAQRLLPFHPGVSLLIARSGAPVLPILITSAPRASNAWTDVLTPSRSSLRALTPPEPAHAAHAPDQAARLRETFRLASGWPADDQAPAPTGRTK